MDSKCLKVEFWAEAIGPAVFGWGHFFQRSLSVSMWILGPDHLSDCQFAQWHILSRPGGRDNKNKRSRYFILSFIQLIFYLFFLSWVNAQSFASSSLLWSAEKLQWILFGSVWLFVYEVHLYMWLTSTPAASLSVLYGQVVHYCCITLQAYWFFFISKYFDNLLNRWGKCFASLKKEV